MKKLSYLAAAFFSLLILGALHTFALSWCWSEHLGGEACLGFLQPWIDQVVKKSVYYRDFPTWLYKNSLLIVGSLLTVIALASICTRRWVTARVCLIVSLGLVGEALALFKQPSWLIAVATIGSLCVILILLTGFPKSTVSELTRKVSPHRWELLAFFVVSAVYVALRFYRLNRIPEGFDQEFCPFRYAYIPSLQGLMLHEAGWNPKSTVGLSWTFMYWLLGSADEPDNYFVLVRFLGTSITVFKYLVLFLLLRQLSGAFAAFLGIALLGFAPPEDWWAREPSLHQLPGLFTLLIFWASLRALQLRRYRDFALTAVMIGVSRFLYPSGLFFGFVPLTFFPLLLIFQWKEWKQHIPKMILLLFGLAFWCSWRTIAQGYVTGNWTFLSPLEIPSHATLPSSILEKLHAILIQNGGELLGTLFVRQVNSTHWTVPMTFEPLRSTTSIAVALFVIALARIIRGKSGSVGTLLLISLAWTFIPGLMTDVADRRIGASFAFIIILAAREAGYLLSLVTAERGRMLAQTLQVCIPAILIVYLSWMGVVMRYQRPGSTPAMVVRGQLLREGVEDDALVVYITGDGNCEIFFSVYKDLKSRDCRTGWAHPSFDTSPETAALLQTPAILPDTYPYRFTDLAKCTTSHQTKQWRQVNFLILEGVAATKLIERLRTAYPNGVLEQKERALENGVVVKSYIYRVSLF